MVVANRGRYHDLAPYRRVGIGNKKTLTEEQAPDIPWWQVYAAYRPVNKTYPEENGMRATFRPIVSTFVLQVSLVFAATLPASPGYAQDVASILQTARAKQAERWEGVETYVIDQTAMGTRVQSFYARAEVADSDGVPHTVFRPIFGNVDPCVAGGQNALADASPEELDQIADAYEMTGDVLGSEIEDGLEEAGLPRGMLAATGSDPWATFDPRVMMGGGAQMFRGMADAKRQRAIDDAAPDDSLKQADLFAEGATLVGKEAVDGRQAFHIRRENLNIVQEAEGDSFTIETMDMWIDAEMYVPLKMVMSGVATSGRESRPMTMENLKLDYRNVPGSKMYESYRQVSKMAGVLTPEQQAEMQQAQAQMAEFEKQMAQMPAAQRDMIMRQMGPQMEMMKNMASGGGIEMVTEIHDIVVNHCDSDKPLTRTVGIGGMEVPAGMTTAVMAGSAAADKDPTYNLVTEEDDVEVRPYHVDEDGIGVLRYHEPSGEAFNYYLVISGLTSNPERPREVLVGSMGPYAGPDVAVYIGSLDMLNVAYDLVELELYEDEPYRPVVRFRPVVDPDQAEGMEECGTVSSTGSCSNLAAP